MRERAQSDCHFVPEGIVERFRGEERNDGSGGDLESEQRGASGSRGMKRERGLSDQEERAREERVCICI